MRAYVEALGVRAPGLVGWAATRPVLAGERGYVPAALEVPRADLLPPAERRRTGLPVKLALAVGQEVIESARCDPADLPTVFCSSGGDGEVINEICQTLAGAQPEVSPTRFHNSVHNAPAGYWGIATRSTAASVSLSCLDCSFAAGLLESAAQLATGTRRVLLVACDVPYPQPLGQARPLGAPFACGVLLAGERGPATIACLEVGIADGERESTMPQPALEELRRGNPAARALPLLSALAGREPARVVLDYVTGRQLSVDLTPC
ncbi:MAG TPA: beta-ketoacyl synthase chain length factor [Burkholderiales bacterium]|jgi:hypothetical protein|nr:beta-ketoacyl synthase chain length factor [Burkholderiales bacterium]